MLFSPPALVVAASVLVASAAASVLPITRTGKYLFDSTGARFYIKGVAYQLPGTLSVATAQSAANGGFPEPADYLDPLIDTAACARDIPNLVALGVNTVRVYSINPTADHSVCMNALNAASIYVIADLSLPLNGSINRAAPSWNVALLDQYLATLNNLLPYPNLLAVNVGNEVVTATSNSDSATFVKAATRDIKAYLASKKSGVLVGYASADGLTWRYDLAAYLTCGSAATSLDIYGLNSYQWCGDSSYTASGNDVTTTEYANLPVAAIFSEFGCITSARTWTEVAALFSAPMTNVWSGGIAFEYFADSLGYGLTDNTTTADGPITTNAQFTLLAAQYKAVTPPTLSKSSVAASVYATCAPPGANLIASSTLPVTPSLTYCNCLDASAFACVANQGTTPVIVGALINTACSLYAGSGGSCAAISSNGTSGVYGSVSSCGPTTQLNYVASEYYASQNFNAQACSFSGNTTINSAAPKSVAGLTAAVSACQSGLSTSSTFVPSAPGSATGGSSGTATGANAAATSVRASAGERTFTAGVSSLVASSLLVALLL